MRVGFPGGPRLEWYDRNPQGVEQAYTAAGVAPHGFTVRFTYTVPTGKKFFLENAVGITVRKTAATTPGMAFCGVSARNYGVVEGQVRTNNVGDLNSMNVGRTVIMVAGDQLKGDSQDASEGGTMDYEVYAHGIEFDA